ARHTGSARATGTARPTDATRAARPTRGRTERGSGPRPSHGLRPAPSGASALVDGDVVAGGVPGVDLPRAADLGGRVVDHLAPLGDPARGAAHGEQRGEHVRGETHGLVDQTRVEVHVRVQLALDEVVVGEGDLFQALGDVEQVVVLAELVQHRVGDLL